MTTTASQLGKAVRTADDIVYLRMSAEDKAEAKELAAAEAVSYTHLRAHET